MSAVGFIGTGAIGRPMALRLVAAGHEVVVFDRATSAVEAVIDAGATRGRSVREVAEACRIVFSSLPGPSHLIEVVTGAGGLLEGASSGDIHVDLSTISPSVASEVSDAERSAGVAFIESPVSGGVAAATTGTLTALVSGERDPFQVALPYLGAFSQRVIYLGDQPGQGSVAKLVNNAVFLAATLAFQEGLVLAAKNGLEPLALYDALRSCSARPYLAVAPLVLGRTFDDASFKVGLAAKDLALAAEVAAECDVDAPLFDAAAGIYAAAAAADPDLAFFSTIRELESRAGISISSAEVEKR